MPDIQSLIEEHTRRELALRGSSHTGPRGERWAGPLADAQASRDRPTLRWDDDRHLIPATCWHCGGSRAGFEVDPPSHGSRRGEVRCLTCSRVIVNLVDGGTRAKPSTVLCECGERYPHGERCEPCHQRKVKTEQIRRYRARWTEEQWEQHRAKGRAYHARRKGPV
jgi:hypothetical protein